MHLSITQRKNFSAEPHAPAISKWNGNIHNQIDIDSIYEILGNKRNWQLPVKFENLQVPMVEVNKRVSNTIRKCKLLSD